MVCDDYNQPNTSKATVLRWQFNSSVRFFQKDLEPYVLRKQFGWATSIYIFVHV